MPYRDAMNRVSQMQGPKWAIQITQQLSVL